MNTRAYKKLELDKILAQLAEYAAFSASRALLESLEPANDLHEVARRQQETSEARDLLEEKKNATIGGARDVRPQVQGAARGVTLNPRQLLDIKATLQAAAQLKRIIQQSAERFPLLNEMAYSLYEGKGLIAAINRVVDEQGEVLDTASPRLAQIRYDLQVARDRLHTKLQSIVSNSKNAPYLQEAIITMRAGRYVIPIRAEARGRLPGIVHDQSASGATLFIEPLATVEINNQIRELELAEQEEIHRILSEITALVGEEADRITWSVESLAAIDVTFAKAKYAAAIHANPPKLVDFDPTRSPGSTIRLYNARHPLLDPHTAVPIDVDLDEQSYILIITGPNTGGKTVSLKTVGLLVLMAQCGLHIPASHESMLSVFDSVYADIGDEQSIEQSLSTFSGHLTHIIEILAQADSRTLVLLDELGAGTDPTEGAAIARAILNELWRRRITTFVATHYPELKLYAHQTPGVRNASVEFNVETLSPTYRLIIGLPGRSNALAIATRLGLPNHIIEEARSYVSQDDLRADDLLEEIHRSRETIKQAEARIVAVEAEVLALRDQLRARLENIEEERRRIIEQTREQALAELEDIRAELREIKRRARSLLPAAGDSSFTAQTQSVTLKELDGEIADLEELLELPVEHVVTETTQVGSVESQPTRRLQPGDWVFVRALNAEGEVASLEGDDKIEVQLGSMRLRVSADDLEWRSRPERRERQQAAFKLPQVESPGLELHLRGFLVEDALPALEEYLDQAYLAGLPWVRIVHGKGTGALRKAIQEALQHHPLVKQYKHAPPNEGGDGVTIVYIAPRG